MRIQSHFGEFAKTLLLLINFDYTMDKLYPSLYCLLGKLKIINFSLLKPENNETLNNEQDILTEYQLLAPNTASYVPVPITTTDH